MRSRGSDESTAGPAVGASRGGGSGPRPGGRAIAAHARRQPAGARHLPRADRDQYHRLAGNTPRAARAMAQRLLAAGFPAADVRVLLGPDAKHGNLVARYRGPGAGGGGRPLIVFAPLDVAPARRADWSVDPLPLLEKDGYFYGRGTT